MKHAPCDYCGNELQPSDALNCHGCGAPLRKADNDEYLQTRFYHYEEDTSGG